MKSHIESTYLKRTHLNSSQYIKGNCEKKFVQTVVNRKVRDGIVKNQINIITNLTEKQFTENELSV